MQNDVLLTNSEVLVPALKCSAWPSWPGCWQGCPSLSAKREPSELICEPLCGLQNPGSEQKRFQNTFPEARQLLQRAVKVPSPASECPEVTQNPRTSLTQLSTESSNTKQQRLTERWIRTRHQKQICVMNSSWNSIICRPLRAHGSVFRDSYSLTASQHEVSDCSKMNEELKWAGLCEQFILDPSFFVFYFFVFLPIFPL